MSIPLAIRQLAEIESLRSTGSLDPSSTLAIALSRVGGGPSQPRIVAGTLEELAQADEDQFGEPLHSLVIVGRRLQPLKCCSTSQCTVTATRAHRGVGMYGVQLQKEMCKSNKLVVILLCTRRLSASDSSGRGKT
jgi:hypothetical protein